MKKICESCNQIWQASRAWNWGNDLYFFKVPNTTVENWLKQPFVQPDELLIYTAVITEFLNQQFVLGDKPCAAKNVSSLLFRTK